MISASSGLPNPYRSALGIMFGNVGGGTTLSFLAFWGIPYFSLRGIPFFFSSVFPSFHGILGGSVGITNPCFFFVGFLVSLPFFVKKERKDRVPNQNSI